MTTFSGIGPNCADDYSDENQQFVRDTVQQLHPFGVSILQAQNAEQARALALELSQTTDSEIFIRHHFGPLGDGDEQTMKVFPNPAQYFLQIASQYVGSNLILCVGNEITYAEGYDQPVIFDGVLNWSYVGWTCQVMRYCHDAGLRAAVLIFPPWHPDRDEFAQFDQVVVTHDIDGKNPIEVQGMRHAFELWPEMVMGPHWYYTPDNVDALRKGVEFWQYLGQPKICVLEYGIMREPGASHDGYVTLGLSEEACADSMVETYKAELLPYGIPVTFWHILKWWRSTTMRGGPKLIERLVKRAGEMQIEASAAEPPGEVPGLVQVRVTGNRLRIRDAPETGAITGYLDAGDLLYIREDQAKDVGVKGKWLMLAGLSHAYVAAWFTELVNPPDCIPLAQHNQALEIQKAAYEAVLRDKNARIDRMKDFARQIGQA